MTARQLLCQQSMLTMYKGIQIPQWNRFTIKIVHYLFLLLSTNNYERYNYLHLFTFKKQSTLLRRKISGKMLKNISSCLTFDAFGYKSYKNFKK